MASWASKRPANARRITLSLTEDMKNMLVKVKEETGKSFTFQLNEALRGLGPAASTISQVSGTATSPQSPASQPYPGPSTPFSSPTVTVLPGKYATMREQKIVKH